MGATSVTGVGQGSAEFQNKGSKSWSMGTSRLIGPRVMAAGSATLATGSATVVLPDMAFDNPLGTNSTYILMVSDASGTAAATSGTMAITAGVSTILTLKGTTSNVVNWAIIKVGPVTVG